MWLYSTPQARIRDAYVTTDLDDSSRDATLTAKRDVARAAAAPAGAYTVRASLYDGDGKRVQGFEGPVDVSGDSAQATLQAAVHDPVAGDGVPMAIGGTRYDKGLGVHALSDVKVALDGKCSSFESDIGVDDETGSSGSVVFEVWTDGTRRYQSPRLTGADGPTHVNVDVSGAQRSSCG